MFPKDIRYILPNFHFMFLIDMKFASKLLLILLMENYHFPILIFVKYNLEMISSKTKQMKPARGPQTMFFVNDCCGIIVV